MPNSTFRTNSARHKPYQGDRLSHRKYHYLRRLAGLSLLVIFGDRHLRNGTMVLDDGTLIKNAQVGSKRQ
jgi:hypothetical protein